MTLNWIGLIAAAATFLGVWIGHVSVRKIEYLSPTIWLPSGVALFLGLLLELGALVSEDPYLSAALGILGASLIWGSTELKEQAVRAEIGWYPYNPDTKPDPPFVETINNWPAPHL